MEILRVNQTTVQMDEFARGVLDGRPSRVPGEEGLIDMAIITAVKEAARTGQVVTVPYAS